MAAAARESSVSRARVHERPQIQPEKWPKLRVIHALQTMPNLTHVEIAKISGWDRNQVSRINFENQIRTPEYNKALSEHRRSIKNFGTEENRDYAIFQILDANRKTAVQIAKECRARVPGCGVSRDMISRLARAVNADIHRFPVGYYDRARIRNSFTDKEKMDILERPVVKKKLEIFSKKHTLRLPGESFQDFKDWIFKHAFEELSYFNPGKGSKGRSVENFVYQWLDFRARTRMRDYKKVQSRIQSMESLPRREEAKAARKIQQHAAAMLVVSEERGMLRELLEKNAKLRGQTRLTSKQERAIELYLELGKQNLVGRAMGVTSQDGTYLVNAAIEKLKKTRTMILRKN